MTKAANILGLIPARGGSKRIPGKNLKQIGGRTLLQHAISQAEKSRYITRIIVSSDDAAILDHAACAGAETLKRPAELAADETPGIAPVIHAIEALDGDFTHVVLLQPTSPLRNADDIDSAIALCLDNDAPAAVSVSPVRENPAWMFRLDSARRMTPLLDGVTPARSQDLPEYFALNGAVYVAKTQTVLQQRAFLVPGTLASVMPVERALDIDLPDDLDRARQLMEPVPKPTGQQG